MTFICSKIFVINASLLFRAKEFIVKIKRIGSAKWQGGFKDGGGSVSTASNALSEYPYAVGTRFDTRPGTNPEELIGAAHSACFTMAFSMILGEEGFTASQLETSATVAIESVEKGFAITSISLDLRASIPEITNDQFQQLATLAKLHCPVSKLFNAEISLEATLLS
jgi:osmotically inducible protein OsmC